MNIKEIRENIIPNCKVKVEYVENGDLIRKEIIPIQHCKKYINTGEELISIKDVVSAKIIVFFMLEFLYHFIKYNIPKKCEHYR